MQSGKSHNLSGAIAGGAETFFGKEKGKTIDKMLNRLTTIVAIVFTLLVIIVYVIQPDTVFDPDDAFNSQFTETESNAGMDVNAALEAVDAAADSAAEDASAAADAE